MVTKGFSANAAKALAQFAALAALASVGGCGGGGGGDGPVAAVKPVPLAPPARAAKVAIGTGNAAKSGGGGLFISIPDITAVKIGDRSPVGGNGSTLIGPSNKVVFDVAGKMANGTAIPGADALQVVGTSAIATEFDQSNVANESKSLLLLSVASQTDANALLQSSSYGLYVAEKGTATGGSGILGYVFGGTPTAKADMPQSVKATYAGMFAGNGLATDGSAGDGKSGYSKALIGDVALTLDAGAGTVKGNVFNVMGEDTATNAAAKAETYGLAIDAKVDAATGNTYQGAVNFTNASKTAGAAAVVGATQSNVIGGFYGPGAAETAGALQVQGKAPGAGLPSDLFVTGAYGAIKK